MAYDSSASTDSHTAPLTVVDPVFSESCTSGSLYDILTERKYGPRLSLKNKLYYLVRPFIPAKAKHLLQHVTRPRNVDGDWFINTELLDEYARRMSEGERRRIVNFWPDGKQWAVVLTHDVESEFGFSQIEPVAQLEEKYGFRSSWNFVARKYPINDGYVEELKSRGFEIGVHGYNHDGKDYLSKRLFQRRARYINQAINKYKAVGFRSPACHRNLEWLQELDISYDLSCFDVDPFQPMPGGTKSIWPFRAGKFIEIPYTLAQDHVLFITLRETSNAIWRKKTEWLIDHHGLVCTLTHPDYLSDRRLLSYYEDLLKFLSAKSGYWTGTPSALAEWWGVREHSKIVPEQDSVRIEGPAIDYGATTLEVRRDRERLVFGF